MRLVKRLVVDERLSLMAWYRSQRERIKYNNPCISIIMIKKNAFTIIQRWENRLLEWDMKV